MNNDFIYIAGVQRGGTTLMQCEVASVVGGTCLGEVYQTVKALSNDEAFYQKLLGVFIKRYKKRWNSENFNELVDRTKQDVVWKDVGDVINTNYPAIRNYVEAIKYFDQCLSGSLIDSSKLPQSLEKFINIDTSRNKKIVLITRDVKSWVKSVQKYEFRDRDISFDDKEIISRWKKRTLAVVDCVKNSGEDYIHIHLENYVKNRQEYIRRLSDFLNVIDVDHKTYGYHDMLGNQAIKDKIKKYGEIEIDYDWSWEPYKRGEIPDDVYELNESLYKVG